MYWPASFQVSGPTSLLNTSAADTAPIAVPAAPRRKAISIVGPALNTDRTSTVSKINTIAALTPVLERKS